MLLPTNAVTFAINDCELTAPSEHFLAELVALKIAARKNALYASECCKLGVESLDHLLPTTSTRYNNDGTVTVVLSRLETDAEVARRIEAEKFNSEWNPNLKYGGF